MADESDGPIETVVEPDADSAVEDIPVSLATLVDVRGPDAVPLLAIEEEDAVAVKVENPAFVDIVVSTAPLLLVVGSPSDMVKASLDTVGTELATVEELPGGAIDEGIGAKVGSVMLGAILLMIVIVCPFDRVVVVVTTDAVGTSNAEDNVSVRRDKLVDTSVMGLVCPPELVLVVANMSELVAVNTPEPEGGEMAGGIVEDAGFSGMVELWLTERRLSGSVVVSTTELLETGDRPSPGKELVGDPLNKIVDVLVNNVVCPPDTTLVITNTVLEIVVTGCSEDAVVVEVLDWSSAGPVILVRLSGVCPTCEDIGGMAVFEMRAVLVEAETGLESPVETPGVGDGLGGCTVTVLVVTDTPGDGFGKLEDPKVESIVEGRVIVDIITPSPESKVVVSTVSKLGGIGVDGAGAEVPGGIIVAGSVIADEAPGAGTEGRVT
ncbi:hypothetical protein OPT61_g5620 [Boeremia exigua]|uniref:Uncharacterized protein n=1 Tax=Boeremia exigua TaxID=749465 RepID=A0ACC2I9T2_9PLEO|nr:hypothetical protein OPT61_g5620 [Boeremia exigua]